MLLAGLSALIAYISGRIAWYALRTARHYLPLGWGWIRSVPQGTDPKKDIHARQQLSMGGTYILAGAGWLAAGLLTSLVMIFALYMAGAYLGLWPGPLPL